MNVNKNSLAFKTQKSFNLCGVAMAFRGIELGGLDLMIKRKIRCPHCGSAMHYFMKSEQKHQCRNCGETFVISKLVEAVDKLTTSS